MPPDLTGKRTIVTGAATGIGRATTIMSARCGAASVAVFDVDNVNAQETVNTINQKSNAGSATARGGM